ncbi:MAG: cation:proton antiporter [Candidatus Krumholzibacteriia bacterium]
MQPLISSGRVLPIAVLAALAAVVVLTPIAGRGVTGEEATFCLGFILIFAFFVARVLRGVQLPEISGYILAGVVCGPYIMNILSGVVVARLQVFDDVALAIIALIAGGEMRMSFLRRGKASLLGVIGGQVFFSFAGALLVVVAARDHIAFLSGGGTGALVAAALALGVVTAARSPATTIGVVTETRSRGPYTDMVIGITVILDIVVLVLTALVVPTVRALTVPGAGFSLLFAKDLLFELFGSIGVGIVFGSALAAYIRWVRGQLPIFLLGAGFVGSIVCRHYHLEPLLAFMIAGFIVQNFTVMGERMIQALERSALPVYVIFFAISGASINLGALREMWLLAIILVLMRAAAFHAGSLFAGAVVGAVRPYAGSLWMGFLSQAGVAIGIATVFERRLPWGADLKTIILAIVALNQLIGPIALKYILVRRGEAGGMDRRELPVSGAK